MRLIDADALIEQIEDVHCKDCDSYNGVRCRACDICIGIEYLEDAPTFDPWHYPAKGEYPTVGLFNPYMSDKCLVYVDEDGINKHLDMAYYDFREKGWVKFPVPAREEWLNVYAWQLIEPPQEEA